MAKRKKVVPGRTFPCELANGVTVDIKVLSLWELDELDELTSATNEKPLRLLLKVVQMVCPNLTDEQKSSIGPAEAQHIAAAAGKGAALSADEVKKLGSLH